MAAILVSGMGNEAPAPQQIIVKETPVAPKRQVLVAKSDLQVGQTVSADEIEWHPWPEGTQVDRFISQNKAPQAMTELEGRIVREKIYGGEPIQEVKLVSAERGFMSAILPVGQRAVAVEVRAANTAGGFILPNDRVDVLLTRPNDANAYVTETVLENIRVLAIDQQLQDPEEGVVVARDTATLELSPAQAEMITQAQQTGTLSLTLRSIMDSDPDAVISTENRRSGGVSIVRFGVATKEVTRQ